MSVYGSIKFSPTLYKTKKCAQCGKTFECSTSTRYKVQKSNRWKYFCCYSCFRVVDKARREKEYAAVVQQGDQYLHAQKQYMYRKNLEENASLEAQEKKLVKRIKECMACESDYRALSKSATSHRVYKNALEAARKWAVKRAKAEDDLRLLRVKIMREKTRCTSES